MKTEQPIRLKQINCMIKEVIIVCLFGRLHVNESSYEAEPISPEIRRLPTDQFPHDVSLHRNSGLIKALLPTVYRPCRRHFQGGSVQEGISLTF